MIDATTKQKIRVTAAGPTALYVMVPLDRLDTVQHLLARHGIGFVVAEDTVSLDDEPEVAIIYFQRGADARAIQALLDGVN